MASSSAVKKPQEANVGMVTDICRDEKQGGWGYNFICGLNMKAAIAYVKVWDANIVADSVDFYALKEST